ncbi:RDD family protein [Streptomyces sp. NPDC007162]|uniref:RDD family protein n=1 Tax=Streptomyces sp. NPDC007162 TaxID=3156917 RepID=UPI0033CE1EE1
MSTEPPPPPGPGEPPEEDPFRKPPPPGRNDEGQGAGSPYDTPYGGAHPPPPSYGGGPYGGGPYDGGGYGGGGPGGHPADPLAGMPPLADSGRRTLARIIDMILVLIVVWLITLAFGVREYEVNSDRVAVGKSLAQSIIACVLFVAYDTLLIAKSGQTLGKKWLGMRVANLSDGATPSTQTSLVRALVLWVPFAFCCACVWTVICGGWSFFDKPYKQGLHDKAGKTVVVSTR